MDRVWRDVRRACDDPDGPTRAQAARQQVTRFRGERSVSPPHGACRSRLHVVHDEYDLSERGAPMELDATPGALQLRFHSRFSVPEAQHLREAVLALEPIGRLTLDFTDVRELQDSALAIVASTLNAVPRTRVVVRGLTMRQWRLLRYFGVEAPSAGV